MTGLRRGEAVGLRWQDLDLNGGRLTIRQTFVTIGHEVRRSKPKTTRGQRVVALDRTTVALLESASSAGEMAAAIARLPPRWRGTAPSNRCYEALQ
ncbi:MAG: tyrosine-type recombinase/integrase [Actinomycetota bacterium]